MPRSWAWRLDEHCIRTQDKRGNFDKPPCCILRLLERDQVAADAAQLVGRLSQIAVYVRVRFENLRLSLHMLPRALELTLHAAAHQGRAVSMRNAANPLDRLCFMIRHSIENRARVVHWPVLQKPVDRWQNLWQEGSGSAFPGHFEDGLQRGLWACSEVW